MTDKTCSERDRKAAEDAAAEAEKDAEYVKYAIDGYCE